MGLASSQGRMLLLTARTSDLEFRAQQISQRRLILSQQLEEISSEYEEATSNRQMKINLYLNGDAKNADADMTQKTNLTYATLISGTLKQLGSTESGIAAYSATEGQEYSTTTAYRLVDADGAIVVSDVSEIPTSVGTTSKVDSETYNDELTNVYRTGKKEGKDSEELSNESVYVVPKEKSDLADYLKSNKDSNGELSAEIDTDNNLLLIKAKDGDKYYDITTGKSVGEKKSKDYSKTTDVTLVASKDKVPKTSVTDETTKGVTVVPGKDGKYTLMQDKKVIARYVVDAALKSGSSDVNGSTDGPNYLQDALRNGKYLLEKYLTKDEKWSSISWDAASNIYDSYYTEDDDKAKAKYDRLQTQIQSQDKKLELELDNIETQRKAITTEEESVQKVIDENIEGTFKTFA